MQWNVDAVRPWEWWQLDAGEWTEAVAVRAAFMAGAAEYREQRAASEALARKDAERQAAMRSG